MEVRLTSTAGTSFLTNPRDNHVGKSVEVYGEWSHGEVAALGLLLQPQATVVEAGSNIGAHTVFIARDLCPRGRVFAFEPRRLLFQMLCANLALNGIDNVEAFQLGLGSAEATLMEGRFPTDQDVNAGAYPLGAIAGDEEVIELRPLDAFAGRLPRVDLIKADVEGNELDLLRGAARVIVRDRPLLYLENDRVDRSAALLRHVMALGYDIWWHVVPVYRPDNRARTLTNLFGNMASFNILCLPRERGAVIDGLPRIDDPDAHPLAGA